MNIIESDDFRREVEALAQDPIIRAQDLIIRAMADEVRWEVTPEDADSWNFTSRASEEYHRRGGQNARSIGGPARAIRQVLFGA